MDFGELAASVVSWLSVVLLIVLGLGLGMGVVWAITYFWVMG